MKTKILAILTLGMLLGGCSPVLYQTIVDKCVNNCAVAPDKVTATLALEATSPNWNDFYRNGTTQLCVGTETNCVHGGEQKHVEILGKTSCDNLRAEDDLGNFNWTCSAATGAVVFTGQLKSDRGLAQLVDTSSLTWKVNFVNIYSNNSFIAKTTSSAWWTNPIQQLPDSSSAVILLNTPGVIYVATTSMTSMGYHVSSPKVSILIPNGITIKGVATNNFNFSTGSMTSPNQSTVIAFEKQHFCSVEGETLSWTLGDMSSTQWHLDGDNKSFDLIYTKDSNYFRMKNLNIANSAQNAVLPTGGIGLKASRLNIKASKTYGIRDQSIYSSEYKDINIYGGLNSGLVSFSSHDTSFLNLFFANSPYGFASGESVNAVVDNVIAKNISDIATSMRNSVGSKYSNFTITDSGYGIYFYGTSVGNNINHMNFSHLAGSGLYSDNTMNNTTFDTITVVDSGFGGTGDDDSIFESVTSTGGNIYKNITVANNKGNGMTISSKGAVLQNILSVNNGLDGIRIKAAVKTVALATLMNNNGNGLNQDFTDAATTYNQIASVNNALDGFHLKYETLGATMSQIVSTNNGGFGIYLGDTTASARVKLGGQLLVGTNTSGDCRLSSGGVSGIANTACGGNSPSSVTVHSSTSAITSFVGPITATSDTRKVNETITNWITGSSFKNWVKDGGARGPCLATEYCQLTDYSLTLNDTVLRNVSGNGSTQNDLLASGAACPAAVSGSINQTIYNGAITYLLNAVEDETSATVNKNGLCEAGEACIYAPNFGAYQGETTLTSCVFNSMGWLDNIQISGYSVNGR
jgi:hypothetical protein